MKTTIDFLRRVVYVALVPSLCVLVLIMFCLSPVIDVIHFIIYGERSCILWWITYRFSDKCKLILPLENR